MVAADQAAFQELLGLIKELRADVQWVRKKVDEQGVNVKDLDERVRELEQVIARIEAKQGPKTPWPAVVAVIVSGVTAMILILDRLYL
jgi:hypothetical protein